ncbi:MAG TPA: IS21 family transposase, partial [Methylomirabilota bacterium]|nr:IS21 family transposase [Methylomirabilota bacterium]
EIQRLFREARLSITAISRRLDLDRKTVRRCVRGATWHPYVRPARADTLLAPHAEWLRDRAPQVQYSARILFQELRQAQGYAGSYDTVKLFVQPLRAGRLQAERALTRFETPPGLQSQIDWGVATVRLRAQPVVRHIFVLTLGYSRRSVYVPCPNETLPQFLEAHERAFAYFGGHTREHLYDRPRTVCRPSGERRIAWNPTFKAFAEYWGFEPRLCQPYRAQTKGKVESGVKYFKRNFLPGRAFVDDQDFDEQLAQWMTEVADVRIHGTTHERPRDRFTREQPTLIPTTSQPGFRLAARVPRIVATDYLVSFETNRYSVPFTLIGQTVEVARHEGQLRIFHRGQLVVTHAVAPGQYQLRILPEHGPGAIARTARQRPSTLVSAGPRPTDPEVEVRDLAIYETLTTDARGAGAWARERGGDVTLGRLAEVAS